MTQAETLRFLLDRMKQDSDKLADIAEWPDFDRRLAAFRRHRLTASRP
jgi:hypothetical protein